MDETSRNTSEIIMPAASVNPYIAVRCHGGTFPELERYGEPMKLCLYGRCARAFYNLKTMWFAR